ncbi:hypothetical protein [Halegenticoccus soli]|uniref:hypothetical protein n=1 Tax=Halegenticoccus soli TaxID=1985678 RepID=UPI00117BCED1|nr:hypothetical protein [Halegenticoccus soli]
MSVLGGSTPERRVAFDLAVEGGPAEGGSVNPSGPGTVTLHSQSAVGPGSDLASVTLRNGTNAEKRLRITHARIGFYFRGFDFFGVRGEPPTRATLYAAGQGVSPEDGTRLDVGDGFVELSTEIPLDPGPDDPSELTRLDLAFEQRVYAEDFYVVSIRLNNGDAHTYFVSHSS